MGKHKYFHVLIEGNFVETDAVMSQTRLNRYLLGVKREKRRKELLFKSGLLDEKPTISMKITPTTRPKK